MSKMIQASWPLVVPFLMITAGAHVSAVGDEPGMMTPVKFTDVQLNGGFWGARLKVLRESTLPHVFDECEKTNRIANFEIAAGEKKGEHEGYFFNDSDVYKAVEGAAVLLAEQPDAAWQARIQKLIHIFAEAQQDDGYLNTYFQVAKPGERWTNDRFHELYCAGHLIEAGLAWYDATKDRSLLDIAQRFADDIDEVFGPNGRHEAPEHPEIELALIKLWRATGEQRYLDLAQFFVEQRGRDRGRPAWGDYAQDRKPVTEETEVIGHAVRAMYLYCAVTDLAAITGNEKYLAAVDRYWADLVQHKMYITGGVGVSHTNEGFTRPYDLPNADSYAETCASIGLALWAHRMNLLHRDARYADVVERVMFNGALSGVALSGDKFLYVNPLEVVGKGVPRRDWFKCACCPPNVLRFFPTVGGYMYATEGNALYVNLYAASSAKVALASGAVTAIQKTNYPWDGAVTLRFDAETPTKFELHLRIPGWCEGATLKVAGEDVPLNIERGYARVSRTWTSDDVVQLDLPMPIVRIASNPHVVDNVGRIALQRGPLVYCLETADNPEGVLDLVIPADAPLKAEQRADLLGGVTVIRGTAKRVSAAKWGDDLYRPAGAAAWHDVPFTAIPYYAWDNRTPGEMIVWICASAPME